MANLGRSRADLSRQAVKTAEKSGEPVTRAEIKKQERRIAAEWRAFSADNYDRSKGGNN